jgi:thiopeptide-type bacteriocin biosynthesis protein
MLTFHSKVFLRAPLLSFENYNETQLVELLNTGIFQSSIFLANYEFYEYLKKKDFDYALLSDKEKKTVWSYYNRMSFRSTPFGAFASISVVNWQEHVNSIILQETATSKLHLLADQELTLKVAEELRQQYSYFAALAVNPTIYRLNKELRYIRTMPADGNGKCMSHLSALENNQVVGSIIKLLKSKRQSLHSLIMYLTDEFSFSHSDAVAFLNMLTESKLILSTMEGSVLGKDYFLQVLDCANKISPLIVSQNREILAKMSNVSFPDPVTLQSLAQDIEKAFFGNEIKMGKKVFYSILERNASGGLDIHYQQQISTIVPVLQRLTITNKLPALNTFIQKFKAKFDGRKIPLLQALDPDIGIDYDGRAFCMNEDSLTENIFFKRKTVEESLIDWMPVHKLLLGKCLNLYPGQDILITDEDLNGFNKDNSLPLPPSISVMFSLTPGYLILEAIGGVSATAITGRFTICNTDILEANRQIAQIEQDTNPDVVFAEVNCIVNSHVDNINRRAPVYVYEIPVNTVSNLPAENQLSLSDLYLSVINDELILESKKLKKRIIPRISSAYNYQNNQLGICRLLGDLQYQGLQTSLKPEFDRILPGLSHYPRVCYKDVIISLAMWKLSVDEIVCLTRENDDDNLNELEQFLKIKNMPRRLSIKRADQLLTFDLSKRDERLFFLRSIKGDFPVIIQEYLPVMPVVANTDKKMLAHQFVAALINDTPVYKKQAPPSFSKAIRERDFVLGSQWLFLKIYCQPSTSNLLLTKYLLPFLKEITNKEADIWFFIRYTDPDFHIRLRLLVKDKEFISDLLVRLRSRLSDSLNFNVVRDYKADIYRREIERYGADTIQLAERIFYASSLIILNYIRKAQLPGFKYAYYDLGLLSAFQIIQQFFPDVQTQYGFAMTIINNFYAEYDDPKRLKYEMDLKFREIKTDAYNLLRKGTLFCELKLVKFKDLLHNEINRYLSLGDKTESRKSKFAADIIHMHLNRLFVSSQREQEFMVYYVIMKYLVTELNIRKINVNK